MLHAFIGTEKKCFIAEKDASELFTTYNNKVLTCKL